MMFRINHLRRRLTGVSPAALVLSLSVCASLIVSAQEAPRTQSLSPIKPPMIKPPMQNSRSSNTGGARARARRKTMRRQRRARVRARATRRTVNKPRPVSAMLGAAPGMSEAKSIKPPMANDDDVTLGASPSSKPVSGGVLNGKAITLPKPTYPPIARSNGVSGTVVVQVTIDERGDVISAQAISGHALLHGAAVAAAREAKFTPTLLAGQPVKVTGAITYEFVP